MVRAIVSKFGSEKAQAACAAEVLSGTDSQFDRAGAQQAAMRQLLH
jgi:hypothetical protein